MSIKDIINKGNILILNDRIKITEEEKNKVVFDIIDEFSNSKHDVRIITKKGCTVIICDCENCGRHGNAGICYNKWACLKFFEMRTFKLK